MTRIRFADKIRRLGKGRKLGETKRCSKSRQKAARAVQDVVFQIHKKEKETISKALPRVQCRILTLPVELRLRIWKYCWEPRAVEVHTYTNDKAQDADVTFSSDTYRSTAQPPVTLFICRGSRSETLQHYKLAFAAYHKAPQVYFNFAIDTLYLKDPDTFRFQSFELAFPHEDLSRIKFLSLTERLVQWLFSGSHDRMELPLLLRGFLSLESLNIVIGDNLLRSPKSCSAWVPLDSWGRCHNGTDIIRTIRLRTITLGIGIFLDLFFDKFREGNLEATTINDYEGSIAHLQRHSCRPDPLGLLRKLREAEESKDITTRPQKQILNKRGPQVVDGLPCECRLRSFQYITYGNLIDPMTGVSCIDELKNLCWKWLPHATYDVRKH